MSPEKSKRSNRNGPETPPDTPDARDDPILGKIKRYYDDVAAEPIPDGLLTLLDKLDEAEKNR